MSEYTLPPFVELSAKAEKKVRWRSVDVVDAAGSNVATVVLSEDAAMRRAADPVSN